MKELVTFLTALLVLAVVQSVANVAVLALIGMVAWGPLIGPVRQVAWRAPT